MEATFSAEEHFRKGKELLDSEQPGIALEHFRAAQSLDRDSARYRSYYGLCLALVERRFNKALELCRAAVKDEFFNPELYHNLARVHVAFGFKAEGLRYLRRALMIDPASQEIREDMARLGVRQRPVVSFLPRRHLLNRLLGRVRRRLAAVEAEAGPMTRQTL